MKWHDNRLWLYGASETWKGVAIYDPATNTWSPLMSHFQSLEIKGNGCTGNPPVEDIVWDTNGDIYLASPGSEKVAEMIGYLPSQVIRITPAGEYCPMGKSLCPLTAKHPLSVNCILLDTTKVPTDIYIGGAFAFVHFNTQHQHFANNVAKWDHATQDWNAIGHGCYWHLSPLDADYFPQGLPGLPGIPLYGCPTFKEELAGTVRCLMMDKAELFMPWDAATSWMTLSMLQSVLNITAFANTTLLVASGWVPQRTMVCQMMCGRLLGWMTLTCLSLAVSCTLRDTTC